MLITYTVTVVFATCAALASCPDIKGDIPAAASGNHHCRAASRRVLFQARHPCSLRRETTTAGLPLGACFHQGDIPAACVGKPPLQGCLQEVLFRVRHPCKLRRETTTAGLPLDWLAFVFPVFVSSTASLPNRTSPRSIHLSTRWTSSSHKAIRPLCECSGVLFVAKCGWEVMPYCLLAIDFQLGNSSTRSSLPTKHSVSVCVYVQVRFRL
jgi:hypothetical protein